MGELASGVLGNNLEIEAQIVAARVRGEELEEEHLRNETANKLKEAANLKDISKKEKQGKKRGR